MRITCYYGSHPDMGYIYLKPPVVDQKVPESENEIAKYMIPEQIIILYITDSNIASDLDQMTFAADTFKTDYEKGYDTEYGNDMDEQGYITGIELTLYHDRFIDLVKNQAFKVIRTEWRNRQFHLITFDYLENVFKPEKYTDENDQKRPVALFKALISEREDMYPLEYLTKPEFVLRKDMYHHSNDLNLSASICSHKKPPF